MRRFLIVATTLATMISPSAHALTYAQWLSMGQAAKNGFALGFVSALATLCYSETDPQCTIAKFYRSCVKDTKSQTWVKYIDDYAKNHPEREPIGMENLTINTFIELCGKPHIEPSRPGKLG